MDTITVNGNIIEWKDGMTVRGILTVMKYSFRMLIVKINGEIVKKEYYETRTVPKGAEVNVIHLMSGG
ncbi:MAG: sulfur carrier protein ThiS [Candidatus Delongbacteria bacterium]|nr:sulfur carrier protein ThiS [Candidatus Delongbacteria bacterium]MCG2760317.1 sulfur carrier protein ThiS [Candidatus Delongbacteria bacterium]